MSEMKKLRFGCELEVIGQTRVRVAQAIQSVVGGYVRHVAMPACFDPYEVIAADGRRWKVVADSSLSAPKIHQAEIVSPILEYKDIEMLQEVVRAVRRARGKVDQSCGLHVHIGAERFNGRSLRNLVKIFNKQEDLIMYALEVSDERKRRWCRGVDQSFLARIDQRQVRSLDEMNRAWFGQLNRNPNHYHPTRYSALNMASL